MSEIQQDAWEQLQQELEKVSALRGMHPELFMGRTSFEFFPQLAAPNIGFHHDDRELKYEFARKHQEAGWVENAMGNWNGFIMGVRVCLFSMQTPANHQVKVTFPKTNEEADDAAGFPKMPGTLPVAVAISAAEERIGADTAKALEVVTRANPNPNPTFI